MKTIILVLLGSLVIACNKGKDPEDATFYLRYELNGTVQENFASAYFYSYQAINRVGDCLLDSCSMVAIFDMDNRQGAMVSFELIDIADSSKLRPVNNYFVYKDLASFSDRVSIGEIPYCNDTIFPCFTIRLSQNDGPIWDTETGWRNQPGGINGSTSNSFRITSVRKLNRDEIADEDELYWLTISYSHIDHFIYLEAEFNTKLFNNSGDSLVIKNGKGKFLFVN